MSGRRANEYPTAPRVSLLVNMIPPYRVPVFARIGQRFQLSVLTSGEEPNRIQWGTCDTALDHVRVQAIPGMRVRTWKKIRSQVRDSSWLHLNPGYFGALVRDKPDVIITAEMGFRTCCAMIYGMVFRRRVWVWSGGTVHSERNIGPIRRWIRRLIVRYVRHWISYGQASTAYLEQLGVPRPRILQIQNCVDEGRFRDAASGFIELDPKPVILYVGQFIPRKGVRLLLESASRLQSQGLEFSLLLVGGGTEQDEISKTIQRLALVNVHRLPPQPPQAMPAVYRSADCLVLPTLEDVWGLVVNEAMWSGIPAISSVYAGCTEEIVPADNRFDPLIPHDFDRALKAAVEGRVSPPDCSVLQRARDVADLIIADVEQTLSDTRSR